MSFQPFRIIGVAIEIIPVRKTITKQDMHDSAGKSAIRSGLKHNAHIRLSHGRIGVNVDDNDLGAAIFSCSHRMGHYIDLRGCGVGPPDDHHIRLCHLTRVWACQAAGASKIAGPRHIGAETVKLVRIAFGIAQAIDGIALHQPHCASIVIWPDSFAAIGLFGLYEAFGDQIKRGFPGCLLPLAVTLTAGANERMFQAIRVMNTLRIAGNLGADHTRGIAVVLRTTDAADCTLIQQLDIKRTGGRAVMRTGRMSDFDI